MIEIREFGTFKFSNQREFNAGGSCRVNDYLCAYLVDGEARSWDGTFSLGKVRVISSWRINWSAERMYAVHITTPDGRTFKGRTLGEGMLIRARAAKR